MLPDIDLVLISWDGFGSPAKHLELDAKANFALLLFDCSGIAKCPAVLKENWPEHWYWLSSLTAGKGEILTKLNDWVGSQLGHNQFIGIIDDDVVISVSQVNQSLERGHHLNSICCSPTLHPQHRARVPHMVSQGEEEYRTVPWVELRMSFIRVDLFKATAPFYPLSLSSEGIDYFVQPYFARVFNLHGDFHVFDDIVVENFHEDRSGQDTFANGLTVLQEGQRLRHLCIRHLLKEQPDLLTDVQIRQLFSMPALRSGDAVVPVAVPLVRSILSNREQRRSLLRELCEDRDLADELLGLLLGIQGYNNSPQNSRVSGEYFLVTVVLPKLGVRSCLDIGAAQGDYSLLLLQTLPDCKVFAVEPLHENWPILERIVSDYPQRFLYFPWALGASSSQANLHYESSKPQLATLCDGLDAIDYLANDQVAIVPVRTLDDWWLEAHKPEQLDFIKIDTEGWEADILDGAINTLSLLKPVAIQLEFNRHHLFRGHTFLSIARRLDGYEVFQLLPSGLRRRDPAAPLTNLFQFSNFVFIRSDRVADIDIG